MSDSPIRRDTNWHNLAAYTALSIRCHSPTVGSARLDGGDPIQVTSVFWRKSPYAGTIVSKSNWFLVAKRISEGGADDWCPLLPNFQNLNPIIQSPNMDVSDKYTGHPIEQRLEEDLIYGEGTGR